MQRNPQPYMSQQNFRKPDIKRPSYKQQEKERYFFKTE